ncbi:MAG: glycyl-radical enzyme activating protein [Chloroflexi bacterium]|nr:glycyl-radical enzyme activating protein [Chloroflexota bacterium]
MSSQDALESHPGLKERGWIFNIQRYSIHDGPGIRTTVFLKSCPLRCFWCQNPESQTLTAVVFLDRSKCTLCGRCVAVCPTGAATLNERSSQIDRSICDGCGQCVKVCPNEARRLVGKYLSVAEIMHEVMKDRKFYENSGGGMTLSGGEPTAQPKFCYALLREAKRQGLHTALDTCGCVRWATLEKILSYVDLVLFDIKHLVAAKHREATGRSNALILENAKKVARLKAMRIRVPLIPGFNDSVEDIGATARFVRSELGPVEIDLLPYNKMGEVKFERLDRPCVPNQAQGPDQVQALRDLVAAEFGM